ncbi:MAG: antitermination protein NusG [Candidatus Omnitrophica bacterium]|nr:antitermination protein NusG [Candidatus Omnitrophota bacterium]
MGLALGDFYSNFNLLMRWLHVFAAIIWVGHLYFFNFVNLQLQASLDDDAKKIVNPQLMPRALWWFRWGAMITFIAGLVLFTMIYMYTPGQGFGPTALFRSEGHITGRAIWILFGMSFAVMMWYNVWFKIWPAQKKILSKQATGDEATKLRTLAAKRSRMNTYLSGPMLFGMLAPSHYGSLNVVTLGVATAVGLIVIFRCYHLSKSAGKTV